jgi:hypothetical protein
MSTRVHPWQPFDDYDLDVGASLRAVKGLVRHTLCGIGGHDYLRKLAPGRIFLQCATCGHETPGWRIDIVRRARSTH